MDDHKHRYAKLSDEAVFCRECGDIRFAEPRVCVLPHYPTWVYYPPIYTPPTQPWVSPFTWTYPTTATVTYGEITTGNVTAAMADNVTFTS